MIDAFLLDNGQFSNYGMEHLWSFIGSVSLIILFLYLGKYRWNEDEQKKYVTLICIFGAFTQLFKVFYKLQAGIFDPANDFPLHLCNMMILVMPFIMWYKNRTMWAITFFWIMAGCAQSLFTPTLTESLPHYEAIRYWAVHAFIILGALYGLYVFEFKLTIKDAVLSAIGLNIVAALIYPINLAFGSNYMYLNAKPAGQTFYDLLGPWPYYILSLEIVIIMVFSMILIPFYWNKILKVVTINQ